MKSFVFSLHKLLETRLALEESIQRRLAHALRCLQKGQKELIEMQACLQRESLRLESLRGRCTHKHELLQLARYRHAAQLRVRQQEVQVKKYEDAVASKRDELRIIMQERKSLENLSDIEKRAWLLRRRRLEQKTNDEISTQRHLRRRLETQQA